MDTNFNYPKTWLKSEDCKVEDLKKLVATETKLSDYPHATEVQKNIPIFDSERLNLERCSESERVAIMEEFIHSFKMGPGIIVIRGIMDKETSAKS